MKRSEPLSAQELSAIRSSKAHPRALPVIPPKEFVPTNSSLEKEYITELVQSELSFVKEERAEKRSMLSTADWDPDEGLAVVKHRVGSGWDVYGFEKSNTSYLLPEEALFLIELSRLELWFSGIPVSVQQAYQLLLKDDLCSLEHYRVFAHLNRLGYRLIRVDPEESREIKQTPASHCEEPSAKRAKLDGPPLFRKPRSAMAARQRQQAIQQLVVSTAPKFLPFAATAADLDLIPNFAGKEETITLSFPDPDLIPGEIHISHSNYVIDKSKFQFSKDDRKMPALQRSRVKSWEEWVLPPFDQENHPLYKGRITPLLNGDFTGDVLSRLDIVGSAVKDGKEEDIGKDEDDFHICYKVYSPGRRFKKSDPGPPCYYLSIATKSAPLPKFSSLTHLRRACSSDTKVLIAVTGTGAGVSFFELKEVMTPFQP